MSDDTVAPKRQQNDSMDEAVIYAKKYLEDLLSFFGLNTDVHATSDEEVIQLNVPSTYMNAFLIGQRGETVRSLQFLTSNALKNNNYAYNRVNVDVADYKRQRADRLRDKAEVWVKQVRDGGQPMDLQPMNAADRRVIHQLAAEYGLSSDSEGEGRDRHIVLRREEDATAATKPATKKTDAATTTEPTTEAVEPDAKSTKEPTDESAEEPAAESTEDQAI